MYKYISFTLALALMMAACGQAVIVPTESCTPDFADSSASHPKGAELQALLDKYVGIGLPGISMVVYTPEDGKWVGTAGLARLESGEKMNPCHVFHSASVAKTYHVVTALSLAEDGLLDLDATIDTYLPDWVCRDLANRNTATVRQLMNHSAGIPDFIEDMGHITAYFNDLMQTFTTEEYLDYICGDEALFAPGSSVEYTNTHTVLLALIMDEVAGNHADAISERIINKLGLEHTFYKNEPGYPAPDGAVNTYVDMRGSGTLQNSTEIERNFAAMNIGHDAMLATAHDYFLFIRALFGGELLNGQSLAEMQEYVPYQRSALNIGEGLGLDVTEDNLGNLTRLGHSGGSLGAANAVYHYPEKGAFIVICSNFGGFLPSPLSERFYSFLLGQNGTLQGEVEALLLGM